MIEVGDRNWSTMPDFAVEPGIRQRVGGAVSVGIRPEQLGHVTDSPGASRRLPATIALTEILGSSVLAYFETRESPAHSRRDGSEAVTGAPPGQTDLHPAVAVARFGPSARFAEGERLEVGLLPGGMRFFDPDTGAAL